MDSTKQEKFLARYQAGKRAFERGQYRLSIEQLTAAKELVASGSRREGEVGIWLVTAYQAAQKDKEAIALCQELSTHLDLETRQQAKRLLYIIQAPQLARPKEWMSEIPDLGGSQSDRPQYVSANPSKKTNFTSNDLEAIDPSQINKQDNGFIWIALILTILICAVLVWFN